MSDYIKNDGIENFIDKLKSGALLNINQGQEALDWMRAQAKNIDSTIPDYASVMQCAKVISGAIMEINKTIIEE